MDNKMASFGGRREFQRKSHWKFFLFLIFLTAFLVSGGLLLRNLYRSQQEQAAYDALAEQVHQMEKQIAEAGGGALPTEDGVLPQYQALWEKNQDLAGWLSIEGKAIDYPVMHTAQDEEYIFDGLLTEAILSAGLHSSQRAALQDAETISYMGII